MRNFSDVKNKKIALLTNTSAVDAKGKLVLDIFLETKYAQLKVVLLSEHNGGFDDKKLEELKKKGIDVHFTHTPTGRSPLTEWFKDIDIVVADIQDEGMRYYTYSSSILYTMFKAFEAGKEFVLLDRTNPLGNYIGGPIMDKNYLCFLGPIPGESLFHGMTIGEKANYVKNCGDNFEVKCNCGMKDCAHGIFCSAAVLKKSKLKVVKVRGWNRKKILTETGLYSMNSSIAMSPAIQNVASIFEYAILSPATLVNKDFIGFLDVVENSQLKQRKFKYFYSPHCSSASLLDKINKTYAFALKGCKLATAKIDTDDTSKQKMDCLELSITNFSLSDPAILSLALLAEAQEWVPECDWEAFEKTLAPATASTTSSETKSSERVTVPATTLPLPVRDLKKLTPTQQKNLRKKKWDRLTKLQRELFSKHVGDSELINTFFNGEPINVIYFRNKWNREAADFRNKTKKYYLY